MTRGREAPRQSPLTETAPIRTPGPNCKATRTWRARHTAGIEARLADARRTLGVAWSYYDRLEELGGRLLAEPIGASKFERFLARLVPMPRPRPDETNGGRAVRNAERVRDAIRTAYRTASDLDNIRGTRGGALQAVTAYVDHTQPTRWTANRTTAEARFERATEPAPLKDAPSLCSRKEKTTYDDDPDDGAAREDPAERRPQSAQRVWR
jgi:hypothetical protein